MTDSLYNRRQVLAGGAAAAVAVGTANSKLLRKKQSAMVKAAASTKAAGGDMGAVEHVVFLMHENRSFDHYFGSLGGVHGFDDTNNSSAFQQAWPGGSSSTLLPFHLDTQNSMAECTYDLSHSWQAEHDSWNGGAMDSFVSTHVSNQFEGPGGGTLTMGYYTQADLPFYYALAQNFTICDNYFCSVLGPTHPNRLMQMTGTLDPAGTKGGPVLVTNDQNNLEFTCSWTTLPEVLTDAGVSWKVYNPHGMAYVPPGEDSMLLCKNVLMYFEQYKRRPRKVASHALHRNAFQYYGPNVTDPSTFNTKGPDNFAKDVKHNTLPAVSWIIPPDGYDEHPPAPPALGEWYTSQVLATLMSNPEVWASTVLFIMYDENDGFFDHVPPPTAPPGTPGEYVTDHPLSPDAGGVSGPIGFGVRVPMLVVSPFSAGGWVCSDTFDHTSQLRFVEQRFLEPAGYSAPNISAWRRATAGDLTAALPNLLTPKTKVPTLPSTGTGSPTAGVVGEECSGGQILELNPTQPPYPIPSPQVMPTQAPGTLTPTPS
jgi:phospholipase C